MSYIRSLLSTIAKGSKCYCVDFFSYILTSAIPHFDFLSQTPYIETHISVLFSIIIDFAPNSDNIHRRLSCLSLNRQFPFVFLIGQ